MATTYEAIATVTVGSGGAANIEFTSIPGTYTDLVVKLSARDSASDTRAGLDVDFNSSTTSYSSRRLRGVDTVVSSGSTTTYPNFAGTTSADTATANTFGNYELYIPNYTSSNFKSASLDYVSENNSSTDYDLGIFAILWSNTSAITSIKIYNRDSTGTFKQYSTATLYGIKNS